MLGADVLKLIAQFRLNGILVDTNLMLLLVVGRLARDRIQSFKRTSMYTVRDFDLLSSLLLKFEAHFSTPNLATEIDNLSRQLPSREHAAIANVLRETFGGQREIYVPTRQASAFRHFAAFGLSDSISVAASAELLFLTDDLPLYGLASSLGIAAINFNHLRL